MEGVLQHDELRAARDFMDLPVEHHESTPNIESPFGNKPVSTASSHAIVVEVWDDCVMSNKFLGEAGVPAVPGLHSHTLALQKNEYRGREDKSGQGSVTVDTEISFTPKECSEKLTSRDWLSHDRCFTIDLKVTCRSAQGLPNTGVFGKTDPYCKVRVKKDFTHPSTKDSTPKSKNTMDPSWSEGNVFNYSWEAPALSEKSAEPLLLDKLSLTQQLQGFLAQLVRQAMLSGHNEHGWCITDHPDEGHRSYNQWSKGCRLLYFIESLHETPVNRTYTKCEHRKATDDATCKMELMGEIIFQATQDVPSSCRSLMDLSRHVIRLFHKQWKNFKEDQVVPRGHSIVAAMVLGLQVGASAFRPVR